MPWCCVVYAAERGSVARLHQRDNRRLIQKCLAGRIAGAEGGQQYRWPGGGGGVVETRECRRWFASLSFPVISVVENIA